MMKQTSFISAIITLVFVLTNIASADVPQLISFQGKLYDSAGDPLTGEYIVIFRMYDVEWEGDPLWSETLTINCVNGLYSVILGQITPIDLDFNGQYWLSVQVTGNDELLPRYRLVSVPSAFRAAVADSVVRVGWTNIYQIPEGFADGIDDVGAEGNVSQIEAGTGITVTDPAGPTVIVSADIGPESDQVAAGDHNHNGDYVNEGQVNSITSDMIVNRTIQEEDLSFTPGSGDGHSLDASDGSPTDAVFVDDEGNVGIGTSDPQGRLHVSSGHITLDNGCILNFLHSNSQIQIGTATSHNDLFITCAGGGISFNTSEYPGVAYRNMTISDNGNVGIGTISSIDKLAVDGHVSLYGMGSLRLWNNNNTHISSIVGGAGGEHAMTLMTGQNAIKIIENGNVGIFDMDPDADLEVVGDFMVSTSYDDDGDKFIVKENGNIGIGTTNPEYILDVAGPVNLNRGDSGVALRVNGTEALWYNGTYFSWGYGGTINYFAKNVGINTNAPAYTLDVAGPAHATSFPTSSDARFKKDVSQLTNVLQKVEQIRGVSFEWNEMYESLGRSTGHREIGLIAQDVEAVFPELVTEWGDENYKAVDYSRFAGVFVEAIKELKAENELLKQRIEALEARLHD